MLTAVQGAPLNQLTKGSTVQARKVSDGFVTRVIIEPRSDTFPPQIMSLGVDTLADLIYALQLFQAATPGAPIPDDWDLSYQRPYVWVDKKGVLQPENNAISQAVIAAEQAKTDAEAARDAAQAVGTTNDAIMATVAADPGSAFAGQLSALSASLRSATTLDIWPEVTIPANYSTWISTIDSELGGRALKTLEGTDSYGVPVYSYEAGNGPLRVILVTGQHPFEFVGQAASKQFFVQFVQSAHPAMIAFRTMFRILWVACAAPGGFKTGRENANGVNPNRNYSVNWTASTDPKKGSAAFSEPETQIIRTIVDRFKPSMAVDCHNYGSTGASDMAFGSARVVHNKSAVVYQAVESWKRANPDFTGVIARLDDSNRDATFQNWVQKHLRFDFGDSSAMSMLIECLSTLGGSTTTKVSKQAIRWYASLIYSGLLAWRESGQVDQVPQITGTNAVFSTSADADVAVEDGGRLVSSTTWVPIDWTSTSSTARIHLLEMPLPGPGRIRLDGSVNLVRSGTNEDPVRVDLGLSYGQRYAGTPATGPIGSTVRSGTILMGQSLSLSVMHVSSLIATLPDENIYAAQLWIRVSANQNVRITSSTSTSTASGGGARLAATAIPSYEPFIAPFNGF